MSIWEFQATFGGFRDFTMPTEKQNADPTEEDYNAFMTRLGLI